MASLPLQEAVSAAVMPLWAKPELVSTSPEVAQRIISVLTKCTKGIDKTGPSPLSRAGARPSMQPDPAIVQQIVEMGFSSARAEMALRRVPQTSNGLLYRSVAHETLPANKCLFWSPVGDIRRSVSKSFLYRSQDR